MGINYVSMVEYRERVRRVESDSICMTMDGVKYRVLFDELGIPKYEEVGESKDDDTTVVSGALREHKNDVPKWVYGISNINRDSYSRVKIYPSLKSGVNGETVSIPSREEPIFFREVWTRKVVEEVLGRVVELDKKYLDKTSLLKGQLIRISEGLDRMYTIEFSRHMERSVIEFGYVILHKMDKGFYFKVYLDFEVLDRVRVDIEDLVKSLGEHLKTVFKKEKTWVKFCFNVGEQIEVANTIRDTRVREYIDYVGEMESIKRRGVIEERIRGLSKDSGVGVVEVFENLQLLDYVKKVNIHRDEDGLVVIQLVVTEVQRGEGVGESGVRDRLDKLIGNLINNIVRVRGISRRTVTVKELGSRFTILEENGVQYYIQRLGEMKLSDGDIAMESAYELIENGILDVIEIFKYSFSELDFVSNVRVVKGNESNYLIQVLPKKDSSIDRLDKAVGTFIRSLCKELELGRRFKVARNGERFTIITDDNINYYISRKEKME